MAKTTAIRLSDDLRNKLDALIQYVYEKTGRTLTRSDLIKEACYYYLDFLLKQEKEDLILKLIVKGRQVKKSGPKIYKDRVFKRYIKNLTH